MNPVPESWTGFFKNFSADDALLQLTYLISQ